ncbi:sensor histidine kinase [Vibrio ouci]|uniref:histidine kinase n=1 Tax=Vibrio ouci TaxID=2499078 RepID=A0A4Y8WDY7_9VIBR|nr:HAMP domain-containing sensor histidine kinase [Vibrio ouci]TFH91132.1 HAMP domain-containing histidine kinase [Vibrio ouci]
MPTPTDADSTHTLEELLHSTKQQLLEAEKKASIGQLVAGITHEVNTPIGNSITTASHLLKLIQQLESRVKENKLTRSELDHFFESSANINHILMSNLDRSADIIKRLKRLSTDNIQSLIDKVNIGNKIQDTILALEPNLRGVEIKMINIQNVEVKTDTGLIYHVISNLILNAKKHAFHNVSQPRIVVSMDDYQEDKVVIIVEDNGIGIEEQKLSKIFEDFYSTAKDNGGTGLGLSIVKNVLSRANSTIECHSIVGQGTTFTITIPGPAVLIENEE